MSQRYYPSYRYILCCHEHYLGLTSHQACYNEHDLGLHELNDKILQVFDLDTGFFIIIYTTPPHV